MQITALMADHRSRRRRVSIILNVYDLVQQNKILHSLGLGVYHTGVQIFNTEYSFGGHPHSYTGIFEYEPRCSPGVVAFREALVLGEKELSPKEVQHIIDRLAPRFEGRSYHLLKNNCNHFTDTLVREILGQGIPSYLNRVASFGALFQCILPQKLGSIELTPVPATPPTSTPISTTTTVSGTGHRLGEDGDSARLLISITQDATTTNTEPPADLTDLQIRREVLSKAAAKRLGLL